MELLAGERDEGRKCARSPIDGSFDIVSVPSRCLIYMEELLVFCCAIEVGGVACLKGGNVFSRFFIIVDGCWVVWLI